MTSKFELLRKYNVDANLQAMIYENCKKLVSFSSERRNIKFGNTLKCIKDGSFVGWCYQINFALAPLLSNSVLVRGIIYTPSYYPHCWLEIFYNNCWYSFDPCSDILSRKEIFDETFTSTITCSFTGEEIKNKLIHNINSPDILSNEGEKSKLKPYIKNTICKLNHSAGIIIPPNQINDIAYGNSIYYKLKRENEKIKSLKITHI